MLISTKFSITWAIISYNYSYVFVRYNIEIPKTQLFYVLLIFVILAYLDTAAIV